ncbi:MAG: hypothetical protein ACPGXI_10975 [Mycobacterium sp.]
MSTQGYGPNRDRGAVAAEITRKPLPWWWRIDMWRMERKLAQIDRGIAQFARIIP